ALDGAPRVVGRSVLSRGERYTVIGGLPEDATTPLNAEVYTALQPTRQGEGGGTNFDCVTRLRDGATWPEADGRINRAWLYRADRYDLGDNPGAQVSDYSVQLPKGQTATRRRQAPGLSLGAAFIRLI